MTKPYGEKTQVKIKKFKHGVNSDYNHLVRKKHLIKEEKKRVECKHIR